MINKYPLIEILIKKWWLKEITQRFILIYIDNLIISRLIFYLWSLASREKYLHYLRFIY